MTHDDDVTPLEHPGWIMLVHPGWIAWGRNVARFCPEPIHDVKPSRLVRPGELILVAADAYWPDGQPVTPWADPWHDVMGDIREIKREIYEHRDDPYWPYGRYA